MDINELLSYAILNKASDLHLSSGVAPLVRIDEDLEKVRGLIFWMSQLLNHTIEPMIASKMGSISSSSLPLFSPTSII
jgi:Tfp pilus assembly pilus retraction ATPase PilT